MNGSMDVIVTDFGIVKLSDKTVAGLEALDPRWRYLIGKKGRSKKQKQVVCEISRVERAACLVAEKAYRTGQPLCEV